MRIDIVPSDKPCATSSAHLLPCEIQYTGPAPVSAYFKPEAGAYGGQEAAFRGRALKGADIPLPPGYTGSLLQDSKQANVADGEERRWLHRGHISSFTCWQHDEAPHRDEPLFRAARWAAIADVLHADHSDEAPLEPGLAIEVSTES